MSNIYANKIFIHCNNTADNEMVKSSKMDVEPKQNTNTSSITILTNGIPEYHIRIKNNYKSDTKSCARNSSDSDIKHEAFSINDDVFMKSEDDKLYLGTVKSSLKNGKYLIKFDDNTEKWADVGSLKTLNSSLSKSENDDPLCVVCKDKSDTDIVEVCSKCTRGYHRHCLKRDSVNFSSPWCCDRCTASEIISISDSDTEGEDVKEADEANQKMEFPYNVRF
jgi:hypothetical protein